MHSAAAKSLALAALDIADEIRKQVSDGCPADQCLKKIYRQNRKFGSRDRRFISGIIFAWFRWRGWLDTLPVFKTQLALSYLLDYGEQHPALNELLSETSDLKSVTPPAPGAALTEKAVWLAEFTGREVKLSDLIPSESLTLFNTDHPSWSTEEWLASLQQRPPVWVYIRPSMFSSVVEQIKNEPYVLHINEHLSALALSSQRGTNALPLQIQKQVVVQDIASQAVSMLCAPGNNESWWDCCSGSGGKTLKWLTHTAQLRVLLTDRRGQSIREARKRLTPYSHITLREMDITAAELSDDIFDGILVDAPCSGTGTWGRNPDARWRWQYVPPDHMQQLQIELVLRAAEYLKPGGRLIFSVCSLTEVETTGVVQQVLSKSDLLQPAPAPNPLYPDIVDWQHWWYPWQDHCTGMYAASLSRPVS